MLLCCGENYLGLEFQVRGNDNGCESIHNEETRDIPSRASHFHLTFGNLFLVKCGSATKGYDILI